MRADSLFQFLGLHVRDHAVPLGRAVAEEVAMALNLPTLAEVEAARRGKPLLKGSSRGNFGEGGPALTREVRVLTCELTDEEFAAVKKAALSVMA